MKLVWTILFCSISLLVNAQEIELTLLNEHREPMIGVNVYLKDYAFTATTNKQGKVIIPKLAPEKEITFSYLGYKTIALTIRDLNGISTIQMFPVEESLQEITIIGRRDDRIEDLPYQIEKISKQQIAFTNPQTSADALRDHANVYVQKSQMGGGSPVLRGFEANKVLLVVDGVRMNNAIYRSGHLQNAITIDPAILEQIEVIYGPGSLLYGSDALGGVVHLRSRMPQLQLGNENSTDLNYVARYSTANKEKTFHLDYNYARNRWASLTSISYSDFGDLRAGSKRSNEFPDFGKRLFFVETDLSDENKFDTVVPNENPDIQVGTAYNQIDLMQKYRIQINNQFDVVANFQFSTSSNIPRYDELITQNNLDNPTSLKFAEWYYGPQERLMASLQAKSSKSNLFFDRATFIGAFQQIKEDRYSRRLGRVTRNFNLEEVKVFSLTADFDKALSVNRKHSLAYGFDANYNEVQSQAGTENIFTGEIRRNRPTRYPSQANDMTIVGAYANYQWKNKDSLMNFQSGLRYTYARTYSLFGANDPIQWFPSFYTTGVTNEGGDLTYGIGWSLRTRSNWELRLSSASAFRLPNLDDFSKIRENNGFVTVPNPDLEAERMVNGEITIAKGQSIGTSNLKISTTAFYTYLWNAMVIADFPLPDGSFTLNIDNTPLSTIANVNAERAYIYGWSSQMSLALSDNWQIYSSFNWTLGRQEMPFRGRGIEGKEFVPLSHIPPLYGRTSIKYSRDKFSMEGIVRYNGAKQVEDYGVRAIIPDPLDRGFVYLRDGTPDNIEYTPRCKDGSFCNGTSAWTTFNVYLSYQLLEQLSIHVGLENMSDVHYRPFASGVSAAGRNAIVSIRGSL